MSDLSQFRLLILAPGPNASTRSSPFSPLLEAITSAAPSSDIHSFAGYTSHPPLHLNTKYYKKYVTLWCDELPAADPSSINTAADSRSAGAAQSDEAGTLSQWREQMLSGSAEEVREVIGGIILILPTSVPQLQGTSSIRTHLDFIQAANALREAIEDTGRDIASIVILQPSHILPDSMPSNASNVVGALDQAAEDLETLCHDESIFGWDFVTWSGIVSNEGNQATSQEAQAEPKNQFGEKIGIPRIREVLEGVDWTASARHEQEIGGGEGADLDASDFSGTERFHSLDYELHQELMGLKLSMLDTAHTGENSLDEEGDDISMEQMDALKGRMLAIRETASSMPDLQRQTFAKREVDKLMRELGG